MRFFKIADETQLVFRGGVRSALREVIEGALDADADVDVVDRKGKGKQKFVEGSMECVAMVDEQTFLSGGDSGYVLIYSKSIVCLISNSLHVQFNFTLVNRKKEAYLQLPSGSWCAHS